jgi:hypothetical protein
MTLPLWGGVNSRFKIQNSRFNPGCRTAHNAIIHDSLFIIQISPPLPRCTFSPTYRPFRLQISKTISNFAPALEKIMSLRRIHISHRTTHHATGEKTFTAPTVNNGMQMLTGGGISLPPAAPADLPPADARDSRGTRATVAHINYIYAENISAPRRPFGLRRADAPGRDDRPPARALVHESSRTIYTH